MDSGMGTSNSCNMGTSKAYSGYSMDSKAMVLCMASLAIHMVPCQMASFTTSMACNMDSYTLANMVGATILLVAKGISCRMDMGFLYPILAILTIHNHTIQHAIQILFPRAFSSPNGIYSKKYINISPKLYINFSL
jgi:hypothetical protein